MSVPGLRSHASTPGATGGQPDPSDGPDTAAYDDTNGNGSRIRENQTRNQIACEGCRQHKQRCDGATPCIRCVRRKVSCIYRGKPRPGRKRRGATEKLSPAPDNTESTGPPGLATFPGVRATQPISDSRVSELYYGPSSNFSLMHQLYHGLNPRGNKPAHGTGVQAVDNGLDEFQYRKVAFHSQLINLPGVNFNGMPTEILLQLLNGYFDTIGLIFPVVPEADLRRSVNRLQGPDALAVDSMERGICLAALSIGAVFCREKERGEALVNAAQTIADGSRGVINVQMVVLNFLIILCVGRYNLSYLQFGIACRVAYAAGLHRDTPSRSRTDASDMTRNAIYWSLFVQESLLSTAVGRPTGLSLSETDNPEPEEWPILHAFVQLAKISLDIKQLHQNRHPSLETVSAACDHLVRRLQRVSDEVKNRLKIDLDREMQVKDRHIPYLLLKLEYDQAMMLVYRPLLILRVISIRFHQHGKTKDAAERLVHAPGVYRASSAVSAACQLISIVHQILLLEECVACFTKVAYYLESACFILLFDSIGSQEALTVNTSHIERAVESMAKLNNKNMTQEVIVGIRTILDRTLVITLAAITGDHVSPLQNPPGPESHPEYDLGLEGVATAHAPRELGSGGTTAQLQNKQPEGSNALEESSREAVGNLLDASFLQQDSLSQLNVALDWFCSHSQLDVDLDWVGTEQTRGI